MVIQLLVPLTLTHPELSKVCGTGYWHSLSTNPAANQREGTQNTRPGSATGLCLQGGSRSMSQMAVGKGRLVSGVVTAPYKVTHSHTGESSKGPVGVQVCPSESSASAWDIACPKEQESRWQLDATNQRQEPCEDTT